MFCLQIRNGGKAAPLLTKPAASGDAFASPRGGRKKMRLPCGAGFPHLRKKGEKAYTRMLKMKGVSHAFKPQ
jgi:hypothetical protein